MKNIIYLLLPFLLLLACRKNAPEPLPAVKEIVTKWRLEAHEKTVNGQKIWEKVNDKSPSYLIFRYDGVVLDGEGYGLCCPPDSLIINGNPFKIETKKSIPLNPQCAYIDCASCPSWILEQNGDTLIVGQNCSIWNFRSRYVKK